MRETIRKAIEPTWEPKVGDRVVCVNEQTSPPNYGVSGRICRIGGTGLVWWLADDPSMRSSDPDGYWANTERCVRPETREDREKRAREIVAKARPGDRFRVIARPVNPQGYASETLFANNVRRQVIECDRVGIDGVWLNDSYIYGWNLVPLPAEEQPALEGRETNDYQKEIMQLARDRLDVIAQNREAIIEAFIAKYGVGPEQIVQKISQDGAVTCWHLELAEDMKKALLALESSEGRALELLREMPYLAKFHKFYCFGAHGECEQKDRDDADEARQWLHKRDVVLAAQPDSAPDPKEQSALALLEKIYYQKLEIKGAHGELHGWQISNDLMLAVENQVIAAKYQPEPDPTDEPLDVQRDINFPLGVNLFQEVSDPTEEQNLISDDEFAAAGLGDSPAAEAAREQLRRHLAGEPTDDRTARYWLRKIVNGVRSYSHSPTVSCIDKDIIWKAREYLGKTPEPTNEPLTVERAAEILGAEHPQKLSGAQILRLVTTGKFPDPAESESCGKSRTAPKPPDETERLREQITELDGEIDRLGEQYEEMKRQYESAIKRVNELTENMTQSTTLSPSQVCAQFHIQNCHACDDAGCGDNQTPSIVKLRGRVAELEAALTQAREDGMEILHEKNEAMGEAEQSQERIAELEAALAQKQEALDYIHPLIAGRAIELRKAGETNAADVWEAHAEKVFAAKTGKGE